MTLITHLYKLYLPEVKIMYYSWFKSVFIEKKKTAKLAIGCYVLIINSKFVSSNFYTFTKHIKKRVRKTELHSKNKNNF